MSRARMGLIESWIVVDVKTLRGDLTVVQAAKSAGVSRRSWQRWEKAGRMPKDVLAMFAAGTHTLVGNTLNVERDENGKALGVVGRCTCGWTTGRRFSALAASSAFASHVEATAKNAGSES